MSLDVYLYLDVDTGGSEPHRVTLYDANITHNLGRMADAAGIYEACWRPEEMLAPDLAKQVNDLERAQQWSDARALRAKLPIAHARDLIAPLRAGLALLKSDPVRFAAFNASNGWGLYEHFVPWVEAYLVACEAHPNAHVGVSR